MPNTTGCRLGEIALKPSLVKPVFATIERGIIMRTLGTLQPSDQVSLREALLVLLD